MKSFDAIITKNRPEEQNFIPHSNPPKPRKRLRKLKWLFLSLIIVAILSASFGSKILSKANQIFTNKENIFVRIGKLLISPDKELIGENDGLVNVLLLGIGGEGHDGPLLTDTMIVASLNTKTKELILISIPRDFIVQLPDQGFRKINAAYALAEAANPNSGGAAAISSAEKVTGLKIPYFAVVDFQGFIKAIDHVGGVDVVVDRTFTDSSYPDYKGGYFPPVTFTKGPEHMNGERALEFARSRHGNNGEGSDFARSERQKKIILGLKTKVIKLNLTDLATINNLFSDFTQNFKTNLEPYEIKRIMELAKDITQDQVYSLSLEPQGDLICAGLIDDYTNRAYVVQPCEGKTLTDIHKYLANLSFAAKLKKENATIEVQNSTGKSAAMDYWKALENAGLNLKITAFSGRVPYGRTIVYDNTHNKPQTLDYLKNNFNFTLADLPYPGSTANFVIIVGTDNQ